MCDPHSGDLGFLIGGVDHRAHAGGICTIATNNADEFFHVVCSQREGWKACHLAELWGSESIALLPSVIKLMLDESAKLSIGADRRIMRVKGQEEVWNVSEPLLQLKLYPGAGPFSGRRQPHLALADDATAVTTIWDISPKHPDGGDAKMSMILVEEVGIIIDEGRARPFQKIRRRFEADASIFDHVCWRIRARQNVLPHSDFKRCSPR